MEYTQIFIPMFIYYYGQLYNTLVKLIHLNVYDKFKVYVLLQFSDLHTHGVITLYVYTQVYSRVRYCGQGR